jgi:hypothetical protein
MATLICNLKLHGGERYTTRSDSFTPGAKIPGMEFLEKREPSAICNSDHPASGQ